MYVDLERLSLIIDANFGLKIITQMEGTEK